MTLADLLARYMQACAVSPRYEQSLRRTTRKAAVYGLRKVCQLDADAANSFLGQLAKDGLSDTTRHNIRRELLTLWRFAHQSGWTDEYPLRVRKIAARHAAPQAWSFTDLVQLLRLAEGDVTRISRRIAATRKDILPAWLTIGYESGLRLGDLLSLKSADLRNGCVVVRAKKTGKVTTRRLSADTQKRWERLAKLSPDGTLFLWAMPRRRAILTWKAFLSKNGYPGGTQWLRRSGATQLEKVRPGMATLWLDHTNPSLAKKHYIDATLTEAPVGPPPLVG